MESYECPICYEKTKRKKFSCNHGVCHNCWYSLAAKQQWISDILCPLCRAVIHQRVSLEELNDSIDKTGARQLWRLARLTYLTMKLREDIQNYLKTQRLISDIFRQIEEDHSLATSSWRTYEEKQRIKEMSIQLYRAQQYMKMAVDALLVDLPEYHYLLMQVETNFSTHMIAGKRIQYLECTSRIMLQMAIVCGRQERGEIIAEPNQEYHDVRITNDSS